MNEREIHELWHKLLRKNGKEGLAHLRKAYWGRGIFEMGFGWSLGFGEKG